MIKPQDLWLVYAVAAIGSSLLIIWVYFTVLVKKNK